MLLFLLSMFFNLAAAAPRIVAVGDLHADPIAARKVLQLARVADEHGHWIGGSTILIQTGDITDKGPSSRGVAKLLIALQQEARAVGGDVVAVLGNHEMMNLVGDWRGVDARDLSEFDNKDARLQDLQPSGTMGRWIAQSHLVVLRANTVFVHGGVSAEMAQFGIDTLTSVTAADRIQPSHAILFGHDGPMWFRGYLRRPEHEACLEIESALTTLGARRMVMGHTTQADGRIVSRCGGRIVGIDTGISGYAGHRYSAFELIDGDARSITPRGTTDLPDPPARDK
jgi:hypothetical protein